MNFANLNRLWSYLVVDTLCKEGVQSFFVSPGMRNAPMLWAISTHPQAVLINDIDERAHAFRALGCAKASGGPAALVCTSGSALTNYFPALVEASKSSIPLIVISSDRPEELVANDANQTIDQNYLFGSHVRSFFNPGCPQEQYSPKALVGSIKQLVQQSIKPHKGPVHLNLPFREPLDQTEQEIPTDFKKQALSLLETNEASSLFLKTEIVSNSLKELIKNFKRPLLVLGDIAQYPDKDFILSLLKQTSCLKYLDITSGLKFYLNTSDNTLPSLDHPEIYKLFLQNPPDGIIHLGGRVTSKHYYNALKALSNKTLISVNQSHLRQDPSFEVDFFVNQNPIHFLKDILQDLDKDYSLPMNEVVDIKGKLIDDGPLSYPFISKKLVESLNKEQHLFIGNSSLIRTFDYYASTNKRSKLITHSNRGTSGIEGHLATTWGIAHAIQKPMVSILGDISFLHDLGSLAQLSKAPLPILFLLVNNYGGGIFKLLPIHQDKELINHLVTPHHHDLSAIISSFGLAVKKVTQKEDFLESIKIWEDAPSLLFLEVILDDQNNDLLYKNLNTMSF